MGKKFYYADADDRRLYFYCPGCECDHMIQIGDGDGPRWQFDGNMESPTVSPSIKVTYPPKGICHFYINHGQIQYLNDCFHRLAGQSVDMKDQD